MSDCSAFLRSYVNETEGITGNITFDNSTANFNLSNGLCFQVLGWFGNSPPQKHKLFYYEVLKTPYKGANQITTVKKHGGGTCGYIFPISSISDSSLYPRDSKWINIFAAQAAHAITTGVISSHKLSYKLSVDTCVKETPLLSDFFPENTAFLVVSREQMSTFNITEEEILINLSQEGFHKLVEEENVDLNDFSKAISIKNASKDLTANLDYVLRQLHMTNSDNNPRSKFLFLYQIIEVLINKIFEHEITNLNYKDFTDVWEFKDKINSITTEKYRINRIQEHYLSGAVPGDDFDLISSICSNMSFIDTKTEGHWSHKLYKVRNIIVHNQSKLDNNDLEELIMLNALLLKVCISMICHFKA
ncbi:MAG: hypothetical protein CL570_04630 [Alphaproteobacteria bacterium]|nr:hypothetical protein [Alphaproteobacteria bacterium]|tara:strand:+ start:3663 stop:4745 length:1083 start_codon:yes stop_codon:yes gene_type:complete